MTDTPIAALIEAVEAGVASLIGSDKLNCLPGHPTIPVRNMAALAHAGSLNAAKALHEALLPGWALERLTMWPGLNGSCSAHLWGTHDDKGERWHSAKDGRVEASAATPARAWLLAILRAHQSQQETGQ